MKCILSWIVGMVILIVMGNFVDLMVDGVLANTYILKVSLLYSWIAPLLCYIANKNESV